MFPPSGAIVNSGVPEELHCGVNGCQNPRGGDQHQQGSRLDGDRVAAEAEGDKTAAASKVGDERSHERFRPVQENFLLIFTGAG